MSLDLAKPLQVRWESGTTRAVTDVVVLNSDGDLNAYFLDSQFIGKNMRHFRADGRSEGQPVAILENVAERKGNTPERKVWERWVNIYNNATEALHSTKQMADEQAFSTRIACLHIRHEYEPGEGL